LHEEPAARAADHRTTPVAEIDKAPVSPDPVEPRAEPLPDGGEVVHTLDGERGVWLGVPDGEAFQGNYPVGLSDVWGVGRLLLAAASDHVLRSIDGGRTWTKHGEGIARGNKLWGPNENEIYLAGDRDLAVSIDTGMTWTQRNTGTDSYMMSVWGAGDDVWLVGGETIVLRSSDAGESWTRFDMDGAAAIRDVWGRSADDVFVAGRLTTGPGFAEWQGQLWRTRTRGGSWTPIAVPVCKSVHRLSGSDRALYVACQSGVVAKSADDGATWAVLHDTGGAEILDMELVGPGQLAFVGRNQWLSTTRDDGQSWQDDKPLGADDLAALYGFWQSAAGTVFVVGLGTSGAGGWLIGKRPH
jgi:photosystem II stability/assembly factor-like uncharacterized protein